MNVMVVDDSAVIREVMTSILSRHRDLSVCVAADPIIAMQKMKGWRPDVILLDLEMPRMDGIEFLRRIMQHDPIPVVVCSALAGSGTETALRALEEGAVDIITKPKLGVRGFVEESSTTIVDSIRAAAASRQRVRVPATPVIPVQRLEAMPTRPSLTTTTDKVIVVGASTGGTEALRTILEELPVDVPGLVIVQHMPEVFTAAFAHRLNQTCRIEVKEAATGDRVIPGRALIAPGNRHTRLRRSGGHYITEVYDGPQISRHRPSVDVLFSSAAVSAGRNAIGVILTGMGDDGADGMVAMRAAGAITIAQNEATSVVFGMPREAIARGGVTDIVPLPSIAATLVAKARRLAKDETRRS